AKPPASSTRSTARRSRWRNSPPGSICRRSVSLASSPASAPRERWALAVRGGSPATGRRRSPLSTWSRSRRSSLRLPDRLPPRDGRFPQRTPRGSADARCGRLGLGGRPVRSQGGDGLLELLVRLPTDAGELGPDQAEVHDPHRGEGQALLVGGDPDVDLAAARGIVHPVGASLDVVGGEGAGRDLHHLLGPYLPAHPPVVADAVGV